MPAGMPGIVSKGRIVRALDRVLADSHKRQTFYERMVKRKSNGEFEESLIELAADPALLDLDADEIAHLKNDWFQLGGGYWPRHQPTEIVVRHGLIQAIEVARHPVASHDDLPIDCYWVCTGDAFEVTSCVGPTQVTLMLLTPPPPISDRIPKTYEGWTEKEAIYTARPRSRGPGEAQVSADQDYVEFVQPLRES